MKRHHNRLQNTLQVPSQRRVLASTLVNVNCIYLRLAELFSPCLCWCYLALAWGISTALSGSMLAFRSVKTSGVAEMIQFETIPLLAFVDRHYVLLYRLALGASGIFLLGAGIERTTARSGRAGAALLVAATTASGLGFYLNRVTAVSEAGSPELLTPGAVDWLLLVLMVAAALLFPLGLRRLTQGLAGFAPTSNSSPTRLATSLSAVYLLSVAAVLVYALMDHLAFWAPERNGGYDYARFFKPGERVQADLVLYSTSMLFASIAALVGCACCLVFRCASRSGLAQNAELTPGDCFRQALAVGGVWATVLMVPWQVKLYPEIRTEGAWILPAGVLLLTGAALLPLLFLTLVLLKRDFDGLRALRSTGVSPVVPLASSSTIYCKTESSSETPEPRAFDKENLAGSVLAIRRSEYALWSFLLWPVYPWLRAVRPPNARMHYIVLMFLTGACVVGLTWGVREATQRYDYDDWRGMMKAGVFPSACVFCSLLAAFYLYLLAQRLMGGWTNRPWRWLEESRTSGKIARGTLIATACTGLLLAAFPLWSWTGVNRNVLARTSEFSGRHKFELGFLHWFFDGDGDGHASLLLDPQVRAWLKGPPQRHKGETLSTLRTVVPVEEFQIADPLKAAALPNIVLLFLEGVTPKSISAYGQRDLEPGYIATPHLDLLAYEGARFTQARACYPSTWDGWAGVMTGRFLRIQEMNADELRDNHYGDFNNLHKVIKRAGINRWCYPNERPFARLFLPEEDRADNWEHAYNADTTSDDDARHIKRGDNCNARILRFIDSLQPGERFFIAEHMADTHFPWKRTPLWRAKELGFPDGLEFAETDALLNGATNDKFACYHQAISRMDAQVGKLMERLQQRGLYDNTLVMVIGDHGCQWFEHEHMYYVSHLYEQSLRIPFIVKGPGLPSNVCSNAPVLQMDILPTVMELAGIVRTAEPQDGPPIGRTLVPLLNGEKRDAELKFYSQRDVVLTTHFNMMGYIEQMRWKLHFDAHSGTYMLYDLLEDPGEMNNLADEKPAQVAALITKLRKLAHAQRAFFPGLKPALAE